MSMAKATPAAITAAAAIAAATAAATNRQKPRRGFSAPRFLLPIMVSLRDDCNSNSKRRVAADNSCPVRCESLRILIPLGIAPFLTVGADIIRPTAGCYEFAGNQCGIATFCRRAVKTAPTLVTAHLTDKLEFEFQSSQSDTTIVNFQLLIPYCARIAVKRAALQTGILITLNGQKRPAADFLQQTVLIYHFSTFSRRVSRSSTPQAKPFFTSSSGKYSSYLSNRGSSLG